MSAHIQYRKSQYGYLFLADVLCMLLAHLGALYCSYGRIMGTPDSLVVLFAAMLLIQCCIYFGAGISTRMFLRGEYREFVACIRNTLTLVVFGWFFLYFIGQSRALPRRDLLYFTVFHILLLFLVRSLVKKDLMEHYRHGKNSQKILIAVEAERAEEVVVGLLGEQDWMHQFTAVALIDAPKGQKQDGQGEQLFGLPLLFGVDAACEYARLGVVDAVWIEMSTRAPGFEALTHRFEQMGISIYISIRGLDLQFQNQRIEQLAGNTVIASSINAPSAFTLAVKRGMDIAGALVGLLITILLTLILGPLIKLESPGPVFFSQERVGLGGRRFRIYKFRSMYADAEERKQELLDANEMKGQMFKLKDDPRITRIGRLIRKTSLDEFPQFYNVLKGEMSLVGTRPPTLDEFVRYEPHHRKRLSAKPGITGLWQVSGRNEIVDFEEVVKLDTLYMNRFSISQDLYILLKTVVVVWKRKGAK